jgi:hypothetical protein
VIGAHKEVYSPWIPVSEIHTLEMRIDLITPLSPAERQKLHEGVRKEINVISSRCGNSERRMKVSADPQISSELAMLPFQLLSMNNQVISSNFNDINIPNTMIVFCVRRKIAEKDLVQDVLAFCPNDTAFSRDSE